jgi:molybdopterin-guanine dinucleotide biosynthesis protein A/rhodanese-related sulfurtransferase
VAEPFAGAVLTGGRSSRMGRDKAGIPVDGVAMADRVATALAGAGADPVLRVGAEVGGGPLAAVADALRRSPHDVVVVLACDLPWTTPEAIRLVVAALAGHAAAVPVVGGRYEPLHAAWRRSVALPAVEAAIAAGEGAVHRVLRSLGAVEVTGVEPSAVRNVNRPADLRHGVAMEEIDVAELARRHAEGGLVLDVRQPEEYAAGHVPGAVLVPLGELADRAGELPRDRTLNVICRSGNRSATAAEALHQAGYDAVNVAGGMLAWAEAGHPVHEGDRP